MINRPDTNAQRLKRHKRVRGKISGTPERPRLNVFRSNTNIYAQVIDDVTGKTLVSASSLEKGFEGKGSDCEAAKKVGLAVAERAKAAGIDVPDSCRLLIVDVKRDINHVFARVEQLMPVIPLLRAANVDEAIEWALILERGLSHTAGMHSRNIDNMDKMARAMNTSLFVKNGPHLAALGAGGEGWTTMTISTPTGEGVTCARSFVRLRRCCVVDNFRIV